jgi:hypothetical protein
LKQNTVLDAAFNCWLKEHPGKKQAIDTALLLEKEQLKYENTLIDATLSLRGKEVPIDSETMIVVPAKVLGLSFYESRAMYYYGHPSRTISNWLHTHKQENKNNKPRRYTHSHAIDHLLHDNELEMWNKADGWTWSFAYGKAWNSYGHEVEPTIEKKRLRVNGKTLYWWIMAEWLARCDPNRAVDLIRKKYQIHHLLPGLIDQPCGNVLQALRLVPTSEHNWLTQAQSKILSWYRTNTLKEANTLQLIVNS